MTTSLSHRIGQLSAAVALAVLTTVPVAASGSANQSTAQAGGSGRWLDEQLVGWNAAGMPVPTPATPTGGALNPSCASTLRWAEQPEDQTLVDAGWSLQAPYLAGWGITSVYGASAYNGMCLPLAYNVFVFVNGVFAGTISPELMNSRTSGAGTITGIQNGRVNARFVRYAATDPLCCPSMPAVEVTFEVQSTPDGPVLVPVSKFVEGGA
ncbi:MAG: LppP/LprE family lipoprotein [Chloroflexi bacterium]|nr:LppP/LprE family lipoprotein [Chloroflexota bacterium]MBV9596244.1 LppP/LprE family lipoprotein [Chloroflexota bacterium]